MLSQRMRHGLEQVMAAFRGTPEHVPVLAQIGAHSARLTGLPIEKFFSDPDLFIRAHLSVSEYYHLDAPSFFYDLYNIEAEALGQPLTWLKDGFPEINASRMLIQEPADLDRLRPPDPRRSGRMPFIIEVYKRMLDAGLPPQFRFCAPFSLAGNVRGLSNLIMDILLRPEFAHRLFRFLTDEVLAPWVTALREECGNDYPAVGADALASLPMTNLAIMEEFALGYARRLNDLIGKIEVRGWWGERYLADPFELLELKRQGQPSYVLGLDPDVLQVGPQVFKDFARKHDSPLMLGIDCALISAGPREAIIDRVREYVRVGNNGGRFLLFLNEVPPDCPPDHVHAAIQAAQFYGRTGASFEAEFSLSPRPAFGEWAVEYQKGFES